MSTRREVRRNLKRRREEKLEEKIVGRMNEALISMLSNLAEMLRSQETPATDDVPKSDETVMGGEKPVDAIHVWLGHFQKQRSLTFSSTSIPIEVEKWITHLEKIFNVLGCEEQFKVRFATYKLEGDAQQWSMALKQANVGDYFADMLDWQGFHEIFFQQDFPDADRETTIHEYAEIRQKHDEYITVFMNRFLRLVWMVGATDGSSVDQTQKFQWAVLDQYRSHLINRDCRDVAEADGFAKNLEFERA